MRTIAIIGTDWSGPDPNWVRQPFLDNGRLGFDRMRLEDWQNVFYELGDLAQLDALAVGIRGAEDTGAVASLPIARQAHHAAHPRIPLTFWADTVGLPDIAHAAGCGCDDGACTKAPFDFANPQHIAWGWERYVQIFFDHFGDGPLERTPNGNVLIPWWGIETRTGHHFTNQQHAQRLLDYVDAQIAARDLGGADHIVDRSWLELCPGLTVYGAHDWFNPWQTTPCAYSVRRHNGVTVGVTVPSFYNIIDPKGGQVLSEALAIFRAEHCDYVLIESGTNFSEAAELMRDSTGHTGQLDIVRAHIQLVKEGDLMDAVTKQPLLDFVLFEALLPGSLPNTYALPWNEATGEPDPKSTRVFSLQKDGTIQTRSNVLNADDGIREWESGRIIGDKLVFNTEGAAIKVFGLIRGV